MPPHFSHSLSAGHYPPLEYDFSSADPARLLNRLRDIALLRTDAELSCILGIKACTLSKIRSGKLNISAALMLRIHEVFGLPISELRAMLNG